MQEDRSDYLTRIAQHVAFSRRLAKQVLRDMDMAEDVAQDALVVALERGRSSASVEGVEQHSTTQSWFAGVVHNLARNARRSRAIRHGTELEAGKARLADRERRSAPAERLELAQQLATAVLALDEPYRQAILLRFMEDHSYGEIAAVSSISPAAARKRVSRGVSILRARLEEDLGGSKDELRGALVVLTAAKSGGSRSLLWGLGAAALVAGTAALTFTLRSGSSELEKIEPDLFADSGGDSMKPDTVLETLQSKAVRTAEEVGREDGSNNFASGTHETFLKVIDSTTGAPIPGAQVLQLLAGDGGLSDWNRSDESGQALLDPSARAVVAFAEDRVPAWIPVEREEDKPPVISLTPTVRMRIRVLVRGEPSWSGDALIIERRLTTSALNQCPASLLDAVQERLAVPKTEAPKTPGILVLRGLASDDTLRIRALDGFLIEAATPARSVSPTSAELEIGSAEALVELKRTTPLWGRVLWSDTGQAVETGLVEVAVLFLDGSKSYRCNPDLQAGGTYRANVYPYANVFGDPPMRSVRVVAHPTGGIPTDFLFEGEEIGPAGQLPDVQVERVPDAWLRVLDPDGIPVTGAVVAGDLHRDYGVYRRHVETNDAGLAHLAGVPRDLPDLLVAAPGFQMHRADIDPARGSEENPLIVQLTPANQVHFEVPGVDPDDVRISVDAPLPLLSMERGGLTDRVARFTDILGIGSGYAPETSRSVYRNEQGRWMLYDLVPNTAAAAELRDSSNRLLDTASFVTPPEGQSLKIELDATRPRRVVSGLVANATGLPVPDAQVRFLWGNERSESVGRTRAQGEFESHLDAADPPPSAIDVRANGYVREEHPWPNTQSSGQLETITLQTARSIQVSLEDPDGRALPPRSVWAVDSAGREYRGQFTDADGSLVGLPTEPLTVLASLAGQTYRAQAGASQDRVLISLPRHGTLQIEMGLVAPQYGYDRTPPYHIRPIDDSQTLIRAASDAPSKRLLVPGDYVIENTEHRFTIQPGQTTTLMLEARSKQDR